MIDPVAFNVGSIAIRWYGVIISFALLIGIILTLRETRRKKINEDFFLDFFIMGVPAALVGARIYYVVFSWKEYSDNFCRIFAIREGGLAIHGAIIGGALVLYFLSRKRDVSFLKAVDILAPALVFGQAIGRWGNFINQEAHGGIVSKKFISIFPGFIERQMYINGQYYHPTFLYESIWNLILFFILGYIRHKDYIIKGDIFFTYIAGYSLGRFFIEGMRTDSLMLGPIRIAQLISLLGLVGGISIIYLRHKRVSELRIKN